jgi:hypothetical protein
MNRAHGRAVLAFACLFVALGVVLLVRTARAGGGIGYLLGVLFIALGVGRFVLQRRGERSR